MSLINQMLKDLEKRLSGSKDAGNKPLTGVKAAMHGKQSRFHDLLNWRILLLAAIVIIVILFIIFYHRSKHTFTQSSLPVAVTSSKSRAPGVSSGIASLPAPKTTPGALPVVAPTPPFAATPTPVVKSSEEAPARLGSIAIEKHKEGQENKVKFRFNEGVRYTFHEDDNKVTLTFVNTALLEPSHKPSVKGTLIESMHTMAVNGNLEIRMKLLPNVMAHEPHSIDRGSSTQVILNLQGNVFHQGPFISGNAVAEKQLVPLSPQEQAERSYDQAMVFLAAGKMQQGLKMLEEIINTQPDFDKAREALVIVLLKQGATVEAENILETGLSISPEYVPFIILKAHNLVNSGNAAGALRLLQSVTPSVKTHIAYYGFVAALYLQQGQYAAAEKIYQRLVFYQPSYGRWWLGLGVAYESLGQDNLALEAYKQANSLGGFSIDAQAYLANHMEQLQ